MKQIKPVFLAVIVGCTCAFVLFRTVEINTDTSNDHNAVAIQIGVFKDAESALAMSKSLGGLVFQDDDLYRVYYSILNNDDNITYMINHLNELGVNYYLKDIKIDDDLIDESYKYENMMKKTKGEAKLTLNKELLNLYKEVV